MSKPRLDQGPDYERGFIDGMQHQMQSSVDKAVNRMAQPEQEPVAYTGNGTAGREADVKPTGFFFQMPPQRAWVGLTDSDMADPRTKSFDFIYGARWAEQKLKERNT